MIRHDRDRGDGAGMPSEEASTLDGRGRRMRALFDEILGLDADSRTRALRAAAARDGLDDELVDEVRGLLAFVDATRIDDDATPDDDRPERLLGCRLGGFTLERLVGIGGTAAVFEATQDRPRRTVAVKVLRHAIGGRRARRRFDREIEIAGGLDHPAIARVYESGVLAVDGIDTPWLAMEFVPGARTITGFAQERILDHRARVSLIREAIAGIAAAHRRGVIHRDLKPANLLVDGRGRARVIDFGIARQIAGPRGDLTATTPGQVVGTVPFMAPEQVGGDADAVDVRTDIYATGVVLHLLLTGRMPYETAGCDFLEAARRIREVEVGSLRRLDSSIDRDLDGIVQKALAKEPALRYQTIESFDADLAAWIEGRPVEARPLGSLARAVRLARRRPLPTTLALVALGSLVATVIVLAVMLGRESALRVRGDRATANAAVAAAAAALDRGDMGGVARHLASVPRQERGWEYGWLRDLSDESDVVFPYEMGDVISVDVLPADGTRPPMVLATGYRGTRAYDLDTLAERWTVFEFSKGGCWKHAVLPGGDRLVVSGLSRDLVVVELDDGAVVRRFETDGAVGSMWPLEDGRMVLGGDDGSLSRIHLETGEITDRIALDHGGITSMLGLTDGRILAGTTKGVLLETDRELSAIRVVRDLGRMIPRLRVNRDETRVAACTHDDRVEILDPQDLATIATFDDHDADVWDARFDDDAGRLVTACLDESVRVFDLETGGLIQQLSGPYDFVWSLALEEDGRHAWFGLKDGSIRRRPLLAAMPELPGGETAEAVSWFPSGDRVAVRTDAGVHLLDAESGRWIDFVSVASGEPVIGGTFGTMAVTDAGIWCGAGEEGGLWWISPDLTERRQVVASVGVTAIEPHPDGGVVASVREDGTSRAIRVTPDGKVGVAVALELPIISIDRDPRTGRMHLLHSGRGGDSDILDPDSLEVLGAQSGWGAGASFAIAFAPDGSRVAIGGRETPQNVVCFAPENADIREKRIRRIGHAGDARHVGFLDHGRRLVTGGDDGRIIIGRPDEAEPILTMFDSSEAIRGLDISPDGSSLVATDGRFVFLATGGVED